MAIYKLGEVAKIQNGRTPSTKNNLLWKKEIPFYGPGDLIDMKIKRFISKDLKMIKRKGTVLFSSTATIGNVGIINQDSWFNQQITSIEANNEIILDKYLFYYMKKISPNIVKKTKGMGTVFPIISINFFKKLEVNIPPLETQKSIIDIIDPLEKIKNNLTKILEKQNLFNIKIMNLINFHSLNKAKFKLKDLVNIETGKNITIKNLNENYGKYPVYSSKTQNNGIFGFLKTFDFEGKYILISSHGKYAGTVKYVDEKFSVTNNCFVLKNKNDILTKEKYLFNVLLLKDLNKISKGSAQGFLSKEILKEIDIFLPPLKLQNFILEIPKQIKKIKFLIENTEQKLLKLII